MEHPGSIPGPTWPPQHTRSDHLAESGAVIARRGSQTNKKLNDKVL